jgi:hypothetical protein
MRHATITSPIVLAFAVTVVACNRTESVPQATNHDVVESARDRTHDTAELEKRVADVELRWADMEAKVQQKNRTPTVALRSEVKEDVAAVHEAVDKLKTTTPENWWERHEQATERTADDIEADVRRLAPGTRAHRNEVKAEPVGTTAGFDQRRADFVSRLRARVDALEEQINDVKAEGPRKTEVEDTRARIDKLQDDLDRLRTVAPADWWDVSEKRVSEYIDRVEQSIGRLDDDKATAATKAEL